MFELRDYRNPITIWMRNRKLVIQAVERRVPAHCGDYCRSRNAQVVAKGDSAGMNHDGRRGTGTQQSSVTMMSQSGGGGSWRREASGTGKAEAPTTKLTSFAKSLNAAQGHARSLARSTLSQHSQNCVSPCKFATPAAEDS